MYTVFSVYSFLQFEFGGEAAGFQSLYFGAQDATAILETDRMADLVEDINELNCSKDNHFLYVSELLFYLKYLYTLVEDTRMD